MINNTIYKVRIIKKLSCLIAIDKNRVERVEFGSNIEDFAKQLSIFDWKIKEIDQKISLWIKSYKKGDFLKFPYKPNPKGTEFQKKVWKAMQKIPYGEVKTYKWIAQVIGKPLAVRAVGNACGANPIPLVIPCHRVVAQNSLGGFSSGLHIKKRLLHLEGYVF